MSGEEEVIIGSGVTRWSKWKITELNEEDEKASLMLTGRLRARKAMPVKDHVKQKTRGGEVMRIPVKYERVPLFTLFVVALGMEIENVMNIKVMSLQLKALDYNLGCRLEMLKNNKVVVEFKRKVVRRIREDVACAELKHEKTIQYDIEDETKVHDDNVRMRSPVDRALVRKFIGDNEVDKDGSKGVTRNPNFHVTTRVDLELFDMLNAEYTGEEVCDALF
ncbi:Transcription elongation factor GreA [Bienertia sinuspersici]